DRDGTQHSWWYHLGRCLWRGAELAAAAEALAQATRGGGAPGPSPCLALADLYQRAGVWADAPRVLLDTTRPHPGHPPAHSRLGGGLVEPGQMGWDVLRHAGGPGCCPLPLPRHHR